jgi:hypothetical protein
MTLIRQALRDELRADKRRWWNSPFVCTVVGGIAIALITFRAQNSADIRKRSEDQKVASKNIALDRAAAAFKVKLDLLKDFGDASSGSEFALKSLKTDELNLYYGMHNPSIRDDHETIAKLKAAVQAGYVNFTNRYSEFEGVVGRARALIPSMSTELTALELSWIRASSFGRQHSSVPQGSNAKTVLAIEQEELDRFNDLEVDLRTQTQKCATLIRTARIDLE